MNFHAPAMQRSLPDLVAEYDVKAAAIVDAVRSFEKAGVDLKMAATVAGTYGQQNIDVGRIYESDLRKNLLTSAWLHVYDGLNIARLASPRDADRFKTSMSNPPPFTLDNIRATFGDYIINPRGNILRALAEVFCDLDPAFKSHEKMKIGVAGLPKRVVLRGFGQFQSHGKDSLKSILNALAALQDKPLVEYEELNAIEKDERALVEPCDAPPSHNKPKRRWPGRGVWLRRFMNGNGHLFFGSQTLRDVNRALAEFYGDVLPDTTTDGEPIKPKPGTEVAKDLQFYRTPEAVAKKIVHMYYGIEGKRVLEPSCGDGALMDELRNAGAMAVGIEVDAGRAAACKAKGHDVRVANFLTTTPTADFDVVMMNPPFYGRHYAKHVKHAYDFLKPGGLLVAILPATARYDHGLLDDLGVVGKWDNNRWADLPVGSFASSGTNINTCVFKTRKPS